MNRSHEGGQPRDGGALGGGLPLTPVPGTAHSGHGGPGQHLPLPAPRASRSQNPPHHPGHKYPPYPNLSGSETDVSTSTENLTQEERYLLRHMEREEPQGEENGEGLGPFLTGASAAMGPVSDAQLMALMQAAQRGRLGHPRGLLDSPSGFTPSAFSHASLQDEIMAAKIAALAQATPVSGSPSLSHGPPTPVGQSTSARASKLNPSVYSHPHSQDPLLMNPQAYFPVLGGRRPTVDITSSGAFFDPKAVNRTKPMDRPSSDIIAQLTREMKRQQLDTPPSSDQSSHGGSAQQLEPQQPLPKSQAQGPRLNHATSMSSTSSFKSDLSERKEGDHFQKRPTSRSASVTSAAHHTTTLSVTAPMSSNASSTGSVTALLAKSQRAPDKLTLLSRSQPDLYSAVENHELKKQHEELLMLQQEEQLLMQKHKQARVEQEMQMRQMQLDKQPEPHHQHQQHHQLLSNQQQQLHQHQQHQQLHQHQQQQQQQQHHLVQPVPMGNGVVNYLKMIEGLQNENRDLRSELNEMMKKVSKVNLLEQEVTKIHSAYQSLLKHSEKREGLEKAARQKLQNVIINLTDVNKDLAERHDGIMGQLMSGDPKNQNIPGLDNILRGEIARKDVLIAQLLGQNKMLIATKERQDIEVTAQQETLEEQRSHIQILDTALSNAQAQVLRLEEDNRMKEGYAERVKQMTKSLEQLQAASEKREAMEKKLRAKLEDELREYREAERLNERRFQNLGDQDIEDLHIKLSESEEKIIRLESERTQWEQRYLEESAMRQVAIDAASIPKDARIAALEKNSAESEKFIADARSEKLKQFEEMQNSQRRQADLENQLKSLEATIGEQSTLLRIAQAKQANSAANAAALIVETSRGGYGSLGVPSRQLTLPALRSSHVSPTHLLHARQMSHMGTPSSSHAHQLMANHSPMSSHSKQLSTPILGYSSANSSRSAMGLVGSSRALASLVAQEQGYGGHSHHELSRYLNATPTRSLALLDEHLVGNKNGPSERHIPRPLHLSTKELLRSATPTAELMRSVTSLQLDINTGRRDSAPGDVLAHSIHRPHPQHYHQSQQQQQHQLQTQQPHHPSSGSNMRMEQMEMNHAESHYQPMPRPISSLVVSVGASSAPHPVSDHGSGGVTYTGGGTMPAKISIAALRESAMNKSSATYSGVSSPHSLAASEPHQHPQSPHSSPAKSPRHRRQKSSSSAQFPIPPPRQSQNRGMGNVSHGPGGHSGGAHNHHHRHSSSQSFIDDSIDSIMGPLTSTHIDSQSPNHSIRHSQSNMHYQQQQHQHQQQHQQNQQEQHQQHDMDGSETYMEVWDI